MPLKGLPIAPLTGLLDVRSMPDLMQPGSLRWRQNFQTVGEGKVRRGCGWRKLFHATDYNNQDFHDQLLTFGGTVREPLTMLCESESSAGIRSLWAATQSRIAKLNETTGNWKIMGTGFGGGAGTTCGGPRFKAAVSGDYMFFTNNYDSPKVHRLEQPAFDDELLSDIPDLETIGLTQAALVWEWKDVVFLADVVMDNERYSYRIVWGDYKNPMSFDPAKADSIAGYKDLNFGERILAGLPTPANTFLIYTTHGIWELSVVGGEQVFSWREAYPGKENDFTGILKYENTLVDFGGEHVYLAEEGPYVFSPYRSTPERAEWLYRASQALYEDLDTSECRAHIGWVHGDEVFFSVKRTDEDCPGLTLRVNTQYKVADILDHGFTAACNFRSQPIQTIRDFILDKRICTVKGMASEFAKWNLGSPFDNEGLPAEFAEPSAEFTPAVIYSATEKTVEVGVTVEDWDQAEADEDSLCALLGDLSLNTLCQRCEQPTTLVMASSQDWCLKEYATAFFRERCANPTAVGSEDNSVLPIDVAVDIVFVVDESGSMADARAILAAVTTDLEATLMGAGIGSGVIANRYASVAFGHGDPAEEEIAFTDGAAFAAAANTIGLSGTGDLCEDAYEGINFAIEQMAWRDLATVTRVIFFITDEDRQSTDASPQSYTHIYNEGADQAAQFASLKAKLVAGGYLLAGMHNTSTNQLRDTNGEVMIAADYTGKCYKADGAGGYTESTGAVNDTTGAYSINDSPDSPTVTANNPFPTGQKEEYYDLLMDADVRGYFFALNQYRANVTTAASVIAVIVPAMSARILQNLTVVLYTSSVGSYLLDGYDSIIRFAPIFQEGSNVTVERFQLNGIPALQDPPSELGLRVGLAGSVADPNEDRCPIVWYEHSNKELRCVTDKTEAQHVTDKSVPAQPILWKFYRTGRHVFLELTIAGTGGDCTLSGVLASAKAAPVYNA